jgi:prevent-host-death family protein
MAKTVNIHEAKTHLSRLLDRVASGEEIIIAKSGRPIARLLPIQQMPHRVAGTHKDVIRVSDDFDEPLPNELLDAFEGRR